MLIGHSQGARTLTALVRKAIDPDPAARAQLVSALLLGGDVTVAAGQDVGGSFAEVPACREQGQTGCVLAYSIFLDVPPADVPTGTLAAGTGLGFAAYPGQLTGECRQENGISYLDVDVAAGARLPRPAQDLGPRWGPHNGDVNLALGDLVEVVRQQAAAFSLAE